MAYSKIQYVAYRTVTLFPTDPGDPKLLGPKVQPNCNCAESWFVDDALVRVTRLRDVVDWAKATLTNVKRLGGDDTLKIFIAPEFYFKMGNDGYPHAGLAGGPDNPCSVDSIVQALRGAFASTDYKDWLIVPGTIFSHEGQSKQKHIYYTIYGPGIPAAIPITQLKDLPLIGGGHPTSMVVNPNDIDFTKCYISQLMVDPASPPKGWWEYVGAFAENYFNTTVIVKGGEPNRYVLGWKGPMSSIDVSWYGPTLWNSWTGLPNGIYGPFDPTTRDAHKNAVYGQLLDDWMTQKERIFKIDGLTFGLEVCLDHASGILRGMLNGWNKNEIDWLTTSKGWVRNDVAIDVDLLVGVPPADLGVDPALLVLKPSQPPSVIELAKVTNQTVDLVKVKSVRSTLEKLVPTQQGEQKAKTERAIKRLDSLIASEAQVSEPKPVVDLQLIPACGMDIKEAQTVPRNGGYVMLSDGSFGGWPHTQLQKVIPGGLEPIAPSAIDVILPVNLQIPTSPLAPPAARIADRLIAYLPQDL